MPETRADSFGMVNLKTEAASVGEGEADSFAGGAALVAGTPVYADGGTSALSLTSASISTSAGDVLIVGVIVDNQNPVITLASSPSLTWTATTETAGTPSFAGRARWFWASTPSGFSGTVTASYDNFAYSTMMALPVSGALTTGPIGVHTEFNDNNYVATVAGTLTATTAGSLLLMAGAHNWADAFASGTGSTMMHNYIANAARSLWFYRNTALSPGGTVAINTNHDSSSYILGAIEVLKA